MNIVLLSSYTTDFLLKALKKMAPEHQWIGTPFNQYTLEILDPNSVTAQSDPHVLIFAVDGETQLQESTAYLQLLETAAQKFPKATVLVHNAVFMEEHPLQLLSTNQENSSYTALLQHNLALHQLAQKHTNLLILDLAALVSYHGKRTLCDTRLWYLAKMRWSNPGNQQVAAQLVNAIETLAGKRKKCLVLDLDNTLWGGVIGDDGIDGIKLSNDGEGKAFYDFQRAILSLYQNGMILAVCSKNEADVAQHAIVNHPYMLLRDNHFAAKQINWQDKASNIRQIAAELNIGLNSLIFLDDSEYERNFVRQALPEVTVPELPTDFSHYATFLSQLPLLDTFRITDEDAARGQLYVEERQRKESLNSSTSLEDFLTSLDIRMSLSPLDTFSLPRVAQLTQRTNQFNLSTRRYTEAQLETQLADPNWLLLSCSVSDRFGDSGIVGAALIEKSAHVATVNTFLMSCRVLGRGVEDAFIAHIAQLLKAKGITEIQADFFPTEKNKPAKQFLDKAQFQAVNENCFTLSIEEACKLMPPWIAINSEKELSHA